MGVQAARLRELDGDGVVAAQSDVVAEIGVPHTQVAEDQSGDDEEGEVLQPDGEGDHGVAPFAGFEAPGAPGFDASGASVFGAPVFGVPDTTGSGRGSAPRAAAPRPRPVAAGSRGDPG